MIYLGSDHAGFRTKQKVKKWLEARQLDFEDLGVFSEKPVDYPDIAECVARKVASSGGTGILVCGTGIGMCIAANKVRGIRAAAAYDAFTARLARSHNDANILCLRGRRFTAEKALRILRIFLSTPFSGEKRHARRIGKIARI